MTDVTALAPGANAQLSGAGRVVAEVDVPQLGGATLVIEHADGSLRALSTTDTFGSVRVEPSERRITAAIKLSGVPAGDARLRLLIWSPASSLPLARGVATVTQTPGPSFQITLPEAARELRAAE